MQNSAETTNATRQLSGLLILLAFIAGFAYIIFTATPDPTVTLQIFSTRFLGIFIEAAPFLLLGTLVSGFLEVYVTREDIVRWIPRNPFLATLTGAFLGFAFPVCECGVVPVTRRLFSKGLPMSVGIAFILAAPVMNPIVLVSTYIAFGQIAPEIVVGRFVITAFVSITVGLVFAYSAKPHEVLRPASLAPIIGGSGEIDLKSVQSNQRKPIMQGIYEALILGGNEFFDMGRFLVIGCMLAAGLQTAVSQDTLLALGEGPLVSVLVMQGLAFLLSVCSTVDSFLALAFYGTFSGGSVMAFLTFGPMIDIKSTLMFRAVFKPKVVLYLILLPLLMTLLIGVWMNLYLPV
ncbi:MAG: permease [Aggregatilineales bacterium]